jgi:hypothetical protein
MLASTLLSDTNQAAAEAHRRHHTLDRIPQMRGDDGREAVVDTAAALALIYGWRFFGAMIRDSLHLDDVAERDLHEQIRARVHAVAHHSDGAPG